MNNISDIFDQLRGKFDGSDPFMTKGHQILKMRKGIRKTPPWSKSNQKIQEILLRSFPKMKTDSRQRSRAGRWARIIHLYFRVGLTCGHVAQEIGIRPGHVKMILTGIRRVAAGNRYDGRGKLGARPIGRPRKQAT